jgi:hypothetical protein
MAMGWMAEVQLPAGIRDLSLFHSVQTNTGVHPALYPVGAGGFFPGVSYRGVKLTTHFNIVLRLRMVEL